ncbi:MCE family protein [bacterium]|nr:MCE family protein [bacterium]
MEKRNMKHNQEFQAGIFILLTISLVAITIFALGREKHIFSSSDYYFTSFPDVKGLKEGAPVRLGGITVGSVRSIDFGETTSDSLVYVTLDINSRYRSRLRTSSRTAIASQGLLGDRYVSISHGAESELLEPGGHFQSQNGGDIADILHTAGTIAQNVTSLSNTLDEVLRDFQKESAENLKITLSNTREITSALTEGNGLFHELLFSDQNSGAILDNFSKASQKLERIINAIEDGDGLLHDLIFEPSDSDKNLWLAGTLREVSLAASSLHKTLQQIESGDGVLNELIYTPVSPEGETLGMRIERVVSNLDEATTALAKGGGTLGALLIDSTLYDNLVEVTDEAKRSYVLRSAIRSTIEE